MYHQFTIYIRIFVCHVTYVCLFVCQGQLVLNSKTDVKSIPDKGKRKCLFEVTCGHTGTPFEISADDQRTKHELISPLQRCGLCTRTINKVSYNNRGVGGGGRGVRRLFEVGDCSSY